MLKLYPEQLRTLLNEGLRTVYLLLGTDPLLLQESLDIIFLIAATLGFKEHYTVLLDNSIDWREVFSFCLKFSIFSSRQILILVFPTENTFNVVINERLATLVGLLHSDLLLILRSNKLTQMLENAVWFTEIVELIVLVMCQTPELEQLPKWVAARASLHNLQLDKPACLLLCYYYEGNLLALTLILDRLSLLWKDGKITLSRVKQMINDTSHFTVFHWIKALINAKSQRALHILQLLRLEGSEPNVLMRTLQYELLLLIRLKRQSLTMPLHSLFDKHRILQNRRAITAHAINRLSLNQLRQAVRLLTQAELALKCDYSESVWDKLEILSLLLCSKALGEVFING